MDTKFLKYRTGKISSSEFDNLAEWMEDSSDLELRSVLEREWNEFTSADTLSKEKMESLRPVVSKTARAKIITCLASIAACVLLFICIGLGFYVVSIKTDVDALAANEVVISAGVIRP